LLRAIDAPITEVRGNLPLIAERVASLYRLTGVHQILIDEAHNMLMGTLRQQRIMLTVIHGNLNSLHDPGTRGNRGFGASPRLRWTPGCSGLPSGRPFRFR
jgi:hypothetical protein